MAMTAPYCARASEPILLPGPVVFTAFPHQPCAASWAKSGRFPTVSPTMDDLAMMNPCSDDAAQSTALSGTSATA